MCTAPKIISKGLYYPIIICYNINVIMELEKADKYFLVPHEPKSEEDIYLVGGVLAMDFLARRMEEESVVFVSGVSPKCCYLVVKYTDLECIDLIKKANDDLVVFMKERNESDPACNT